MGRVTPQINQVNIDYETELNKYMEQYQEALEKLKEILKPHMGKNDPTQRGTPALGGPCSPTMY